MNCLVNKLPDCRFACPIEAAARMNPTRDVFVVFESPVGMRRHEKDWSTTIKMLMQYPNIHFRNVQVKELCANTPLEDWIESDWHKLYQWNLTRVLLVYKYGGTFLDTSYMMLRPLTDMQRNWVGIEDGNKAVHTAFDFLHNGIGHFVMNEVLGYVFDA